MSVTDAVRIMTLIVSVGALIEGAEALSVHAVYDQAGIMSFGVLRTGRSGLNHGPLSRPLGWIFEYPRVLAVPVVQIGSATLLIVLALVYPAGYRPAAIICCGALLVARFLIHYRNVFGFDGSDQMMVVVLISAFAALIAGDGPVGVIALGYAAGQLMLSYIVAGYSKVTSPIWRSGNAIVGILGTVGYGYPPFAAILRDRRRLARAVCWSVICFECLAPILVLAGVPGVVILFVFALAFHGAIAVLMGLNIFLWSFAAAYPALAVVVAHISIW